MSNPFVAGKRPQQKSIEHMIEWLDSLGLRVYGEMVHEDGEVTGLHDFDAERIVRLRNNLESLHNEDTNQ